MIEVTGVLGKCGAHSKIPLSVMPYWSFFRLRPLALSALVVLGMVALAADLAGIGLILPLLSLMRGTPSAGSGPELINVPAIQWATGWLLASPPRARLISIAAIVAGVGLLKSAAGYFRSYLTSWIFANVSRDLHRRCYNRFLQIPIPEVLLGDTSSFTNAIVSFPREAATGVLAAAQLIIGAMSGLTIVALVLLVSWKVGAVAVLLSVASAGVVWALLIRRVSGFGEEINSRGIEFYGWIIESVRGRLAIDGLGMHVLARARLDALAESLVAITLTRDRLRALVDPALSFVGAALVAGLFLLAARDEGNISANLGESIILVVCLTRLMAPMSTLNAALSDLHAYKNSVERVCRFLEWRPEIEDNGENYFGLGRSIEFRKVSYSYAGRSEPALNGVCFELEKNSMVALVGRSGAGKSTIVNLLMRFIDPTDGNIFVDGAESRKFRRAAWQSKIAYVPQDSFLFDDTIESNIKSGIDAAPAEVEAAAAKAHAIEFISSLPLGFATKVGENAVRLSGGQKQRIAIARAVLRQPDVLILDEATSNLDSVSEHAIRQSLSELRKSCAVLVVAHRMSTIVDSDLILVMDKGRIVERGTHGDLLLLGGLYEQMWILQNREVTPQRNSTSDEN